MAFPKEILRFYTRETRLPSDYFFQYYLMSSRIFFYLVSRKMKVFNDLWLLKKSMHFSGNGPCILVKFWIEKGTFKMAAQNFDIQISVHDMIRTYSQMHRTDKYSQHSSIIWPVWLNG